MADRYTLIKEFKGIKNNEDRKNVPPEYFFNIINCNFPDAGIFGFDKILMPTRINQLTSAPIDGLFEYNFLDSNNILQKQIIGISDGQIFKNVLTTPELIFSGLSAGKVTFAIFNDRLYIANGKNFVTIYDGNKDIITQMGAPIATLGSLGVLNGDYFYVMTYVTAGGEEIVGSISNTITTTNDQIELFLPIGYSGTLTRKLYRTSSNSSTLKFLTEIEDNNTLTFSDNILDINLGSVFINIPNNELPKPYFIKVFQERLIGGVVDLFPTQVFITDAEIDVFDSSNNLDISNFADDESRVTAVNIDFSKVVIGTERHLYLLTLGTPTTVTTTRVNVGIKDGYTAIRVPSNATFEGGLMFVSTENDVRMLQGLEALPVATSVDNIRTLDLAQNIRGTLDKLLKTSANLHAEFFDYKYHLLIDGIKYVLDIRNLGWTHHNIQTENFASRPVILKTLNSFLYNGQPNGFIEEEYQTEKYLDEDVVAILETPEIEVSSFYVFVQKLKFWLIPNVRNKQEITVIINDDEGFKKVIKFTFAGGGAFDEEFFNPVFFQTGRKDMDYRILNIYQPLRWIRFVFKNVEGFMKFRGWGIQTEKLRNKEL